MERTAPLRDVTALVRPELERVNDELVADLTPEQPELQPLLEHVGRYRGKQLRPALVLLTAKATGAVVDTHFTVAKVVELLHTATLVHDDILDTATMRRQLATVNALHGHEISVLLGDYLYARAFHLAVELDDPACARVLSEVTRVICQGEITQLLHRLDFDWTEERYLKVIGDKTGSLFGAAAQLGAHYAGAGAATAGALGRYGMALGTAFQIVDDCLDLRGEERIVGKTLGSDLDKGKLTLPLLYLLHSTADAGPRLRRLIGESCGTARLAEEFDVNGAVEFAMARARALTEEAESCLREVPQGPAREALADLSQYVVRREL